MPESRHSRWPIGAALAAGLALSLLTVFGGVVAAFAGVLAQPLFALAVSGWRRRIELVSLPAWKRDGLNLTGLWAAGVAVLALALAWPLSALLQSGSLAAALGVSAVAGGFVLALWRSWPLWHALERDGGSLREHAQSLAELDLGAWRGLGVAVAVGIIAAAVVVLAWPGLVPGEARWPWAVGFALVSPALHAWLQRIAPAEPVLMLEDEPAGALDAALDLPLADGDPLEPALYAAARTGRVERALELIDAGADPHAPPPSDERDQRSLPVLAAVLPDLRLLRALIARGVDLNGAHAGMTPLIAATRDSWHGRPDAVMTLLANGADPRAVDSDGNTPLHHAARSSDPGVAALLRDAAAELDPLNHDGLSPLGVACASGNWRLARFLLERGAKTDPADGQPALLAAAGGEDDDAAGIHLLLKQKAKINARNRDGRSALHEAAFGGHVEMVTALLAAGADVTATDAQGRNAALEAARGGRLAVLDLLLEQLPRVSATEAVALDADGRNALILACAAPATTPELIARLLELGVEREQRDAEGKRAIDRAAEAGRWALVAALDPSYAMPARVSDGDNEVAQDDTGGSGPPPDRAPAALLRDALREGREHGMDGLAQLLGPSELGALLHDGDSLPSPTQIEWLLARGAAADVRDGAGDTPLFAWLARGAAAMPQMQALLRHAVAPAGRGGLARFLSACVAVESATRGPDTAALKQPKHAKLAAAKPVGPKQLALEQFALDLLERGADPFAPSGAGDPPLTLTVRLGWPRLLARLLAGGIALDVRDSHGMSALHLAAALGREATLKQLIAHGAAPDLLAADGQTPLGVALASGRRDLADWLDWRGWSLPRRPLQSIDVPAAAIVGDADAVRRLLDLGLPVDAADGQGCTALLRAAGGGHRAVVDLLLARGADPLLPAHSGATPLSAAVSMRHIEIVDRLIGAGATLEQRLPGELTVLMVACALGLPDLAARLLAAGADIHAADAQGRTAIHCAAMYGFGARERSRLVALLDTLLLAGAEADEPAAGVTSLLLLLGSRAEPGSAADEDVLIAGLELLADNDARLDVQDPRGFGPLHLAALHGLLSVVQWLIRAGADPDLRDALNRTPREIAVMRGFVDIAAEFAPAVPGNSVSMARFLRDPR
ncbi:ankyrin repeat domain-containing protein [Lysobacter sp. D1-1-M9]|uniref:ankyrin repeat domain-containing protein n=2 Tax=Novilysobacter longmucuonensis TaxID=3098603 RepID=UPI0039839BCC